MHRYSFVNSLWYSLLRRLYHSNQTASPRGFDIHEILGVQVVLTDVRNNVLTLPFRNVNHRFMVAEWLWMWFGRDDVATIDKYNSRLKRFSDDGATFNGAYGVPIKAQWPRLVELLRQDPDSRQAVLSIFRPQTVASKDVPCTISLQFLVRRGALTTIATMRSSDVWLGLPYDIFNFTMFAQCMAAELGITARDLVLNLGSSHLYATDRELAKCLITNRPYETDRVSVSSPRLVETPPAWLEGVLTDPETALVTTFCPMPPEPWLTYASILMDTRAKATERLIRLSQLETA